MGYMSPQSAGEVEDEAAIPHQFSAFSENRERLALVALRHDDRAESQHVRRQY
jgi:hypothetical protein